MYEPYIQEIYRTDIQNQTPSMKLTRDGDPHTLLFSPDCLFCLVDEKLSFKQKAAPKIPKATEAAKHKAGGGNVEICTPTLHHHECCVLPVFGHVLLCCADLYLLFLSVSDIYLSISGQWIANQNGKPNQRSQRPQKLLSIKQVEEMWKSVRLHIHVWGYFMQMYPLLGLEALNGRT